MMRNFQDCQRTCVRAARHVLLLPRLGIASQENARRAVAKEDGHRDVVGLTEELAGRRGDDVLDNSTRRRSLPLVLLVREDAPAREVVATVHGEVRATYGLDCRERTFYSVLH